MRTFRLIGMALIAMLMSVNFTACSSDDDESAKNDDGIITNQKKLVEFKTTDDSETMINEFSYDSKGRLHLPLLGNSKMKNNYYYITLKRYTLAD